MEHVHYAYSMGAYESNFYSQFVIFNSSGVCFLSLHSYFPYIYAENVSIRLHHGDPIEKKKLAKAFNIHLALSLSILSGLEWKNTGLGLIEK